MDCIVHGVSQTWLSNFHLHFHSRQVRTESPTPDQGPRLLGLWPVRNQGAQQEARSGRASEASSVFATTSVAQTVRNLPSMKETQVQSLGQEDSLEKWLATYSSVLAWIIPWTEEPGGLQSTVHVKRVAKSWTWLSDWLSPSLALPPELCLLVSDQQWH